MSILPELRLVIVTGQAGAGLNTARTVLEDNGFKVVDNTPVSLLSKTLEQLAEHAKAIAFGVDIRTEGYDAQKILDFIREQAALPNCKVKLLYLECDDDVLLQRFSSTRRRHPLASHTMVAESVEQERHLLEPLKKRADVMLDTTKLNANDLRRIISGHFPPQESRLGLEVMSFSYRLGVPREADYVFDVRFLRNPHWQPDLRAHTGQNVDVASYIAEDSVFDAYWQNLTALLSTALPRYGSEGRQYLTLAFGCTGGKHRSVFMAEKMASWLQEQGYAPHVRHREQEQKHTS